jgi:Xaa-Pro aminopeptidase
MDYVKELQGRIRRVQNRLEAENIDALYISSPKNVRYLSGRESGRILLTKKRGFLWVRELYTGVYKSLYEKKGYPLEVRVHDAKAVPERTRKLGCKTLGIENVTIGQYRRMRETLKCRLKATSMVEENRAVKTKYELALIKKSASMASTAMKKAYGLIRKGAREIDVAAELEYEIRKMGSETPPFNDGMLLASGHRSADIHAHATAARITKGPVIVDLGAMWKGYYSDMTRTIEAGSPGGVERRLIESVRNLELEAADRIREGTKACEAHRLVESGIKAMGLEFHHAAGHGIGLEVHEKPHLNPDSKDVFAEGMVFTVEPGIYLPGRFGIRFEDMFVLTKNGCKALTV